MNFFNKLGIILSLFFLTIFFPAQMGFAFNIENSITFLPPGTELVFKKETIISKFKEKMIGRSCSVKTNSTSHIVKIERGSKFILKKLDAGEGLCDPFSHLVCSRRYHTTITLTSTKSSQDSKVILTVWSQDGYPSINEVFAKCLATSEISLECKKWCGLNISVEKIPPIPEM